MLYDNHEMPLECGWSDLDEIYLCEKLQRHWIILTLSSMAPKFNGFKGIIFLSFQPNNE